LEVDRQYPFTPPKVRFLTPIWHPNISVDGKVCISILGEDWTPALDLVGVIESIRNLLNFPNPNSPLNVAAAKQMKSDPKKFLAKVKEYIRKYCKWKT